MYLSYHSHHDFLHYNVHSHIVFFSFHRNFVLFPIWFRFDLILHWKKKSMWWLFTSRLLRSFVSDSLITKTDWFGCGISQNWIRPTCISGFIPCLFLPFCLFIACALARISVLQTRSRLFTICCIIPFVSSLSRLSKITPTPFCSILCCYYVDGDQRGVNANAQRSAELRKSWFQSNRRSPDLVQLFDSVPPHSCVGRFLFVLWSLFRKRVRSGSHELQLEEPKIVHCFADFQLGSVGQWKESTLSAPFPDLRGDLSCDFGSRSRRLFRILLQAERTRLSHLFISSQRAGGATHHRLDSLLYQQINVTAVLPMQPYVQADEAVDSKQSDTSPWTEASIWMEYWKPIIGSVLFFVFDCRWA